MSLEDFTVHQLASSVETVLVFQGHRILSTNLAVRLIKRRQAAEGCAVRRTAVRMRSSGSNVWTLGSRGCCVILKPLDNHQDVLVQRQFDWWLVDLFFAPAPPSPTAIGGQTTAFYPQLQQLAGLAQGKFADAGSEISPPSGCSTITLTDLPT